MKGSLSDKSALSLLWQLHTQEFHGLVHLKHDASEVLVQFRQGHVTFVDSSLAKHSLSTFLRDTNQLTPQHILDLEARAQSGTPLEDLLLQDKLAQPSQVLAWLEQLHALRLQDLLTWRQGHFETLPGQEPGHPPLQISLPKLTLDAAQKGLLHLPNPSEATWPTKLYVSSRWKRYAQASAFGPLFAHMLKACTSGATWESLKQTYAQDLPRLTLMMPLALALGFVQAEAPTELMSLDELVGASLTQRKSAPSAAPSVSLEQLRQELTDLALRLSGLTDFEVLGVSEQASPTEIRDAFIARTLHLGPQHFIQGEAASERLRAEDVFLRMARAYHTLTDPDLKMKYTDRLKAQHSAVPKSKAGEAFKIQTRLLDAPSQFERGLQYLRKHQYAMAEEFFQYAHDVDSKSANYLAHLAWAKYCQSPERQRKPCTTLLEEALALNPKEPWAHHYLGSMLIAAPDKAQKKQGLESLRRATSLDPQNPTLLRAYRNAQSEVK